LYKNYSTARENGVVYPTDASGRPANASVRPANAGVISTNASGNGWKAGI
jgi:hypothetical protein